MGATMLQNEGLRGTPGLRMGVYMLPLYVECLATFAPSTASLAKRWEVGPPEECEGVSLESQAPLRPINTRFVALFTAVLLLVFCKLARLPSCQVGGLIDLQEPC